MYDRAGNTADDRPVHPLNAAPWIIVTSSNVMSDRFVHVLDEFDRVAELFQNLAGYEPMMEAVM